MAPETEETTPAVVESTPEAPPVAPEETGAEPLDAPISELAEFRAARQAERSGEIADEPVAEPVAESVDATNTADEKIIDSSQQVYDPDTGDVLDRRTRAAKRIEALLRERHQLRQQVSEQQGALQQAATQSQTAPPSEVSEESKIVEADTPPTLEQFQGEPDPYAAYTAALARWETRYEFQKQAELQSTAERTAQVEARIEQAQAVWDSKLDEVRKHFPDFDKAYNVLYETLPTDGKQRPLVETLLTSSIGHAMAHYLGTHPKAVSDLYNQPTLKAHLRAIGKLEARIEAVLTNATAKSAPSNSVAVPPAPMNPVGAAATPTSYDARTATLAQFRKRHGVRGGRRSV